MAPAKKKNFTIELPEECGKVPKLTGLNQSGYVLWDEVDEDLQALVNKHMETMSASMTVGNVVFVLCGQADEKANGNPTQNRYIMFWVGIVCDHKNPAPGKKIQDQVSRWRNILFWERQGALGPSIRITNNHK